MAHVLVTRPQPSADQTGKRLRILGHQPTILPLAEAEHDSRSALNALQKQPAAIAVTSGETLRVLGRLGPALRPYHNTPLFAVGTATAEAARLLGFTTILASGGNAENLASLIAKEVSGPVLYLAGSPRSASLETRLAQSDTSFSVAECYRMLDIPYPVESIQTLFASDGPDAVLLYSAESARRFFALPALAVNGPLLGAVRLLCMSNHVANAVPARHVDRISVATEPTEAALFALL